MNTDRRGHGRAAPPRRGRAWRLVALAALACAGAPLPAASQEVGVPPARSPFRDIVNHQSFTVFFGRFAGNTGAAGVGARGATAFGARLAIRLSGPVDFVATVGEAASSRRTIDAGGTTVGDSSRVTGTTKLPLVLADLALSLNITGDKTWHHLAPYFLMGLGVASTTRAVTDPGGFRVGTAFTLVPTLGTRLFLGRDLALHVEVRDYYFKYTYPLGFFALPYAGPPARASLLPTSASTGQWTHNLTLWAGLSYGFSF
jgi:hypothetical protein